MSIRYGHKNGSRLPVMVKRNRNKSGSALRRRLLEQLLNDISRMSPGTRLPSQIKLAERYSTSVLTIREAVSALAAKGILDIQQGNGTYVTDPTRNRWMAVLSEVDLISDRTSFMYRHSVVAARKRCEEAGFATRIYSGRIVPGLRDETQEWVGVDSSCPELLDDLDQHRLAGVVVVGSCSIALAERFKAMKLPYSVIGVPHLANHTVSSSETAVVLQMAMDYLLTQGRRRIAVLSWSSTAKMVSMARGYTINLRPEWIRCDLHPAIPGSGWKEFREIWYARDEKPDGLIVTDDILFQDAIPGIAKLDIRIPEDLLVVIENQSLHRMFVPFPVAYINADPEAIGRTAAELLLQVFDNPGTPPEHIEIHPTLVPLTEFSPDISDSTVE